MAALGWSISLTVGAHVESGGYLLGAEADASWTWSWSGKNGYEGGKGEKTASATFGTIGVEGYVYGKLSASYPLDFFECSKKAEAGNQGGQS